MADHRPDHLDRSVIGDHQVVVKGRTLSGSPADKEEKALTPKLARQRIKAVRLESLGLCSALGQLPQKSLVKVHLEKMLSFFSSPTPLPEILDGDNDNEIRVAQPLAKEALINDIAGRTPDKHHRGKGDPIVKIRGVARLHRRRTRRRCQRLGLGFAAHAHSQ